jgi:hypothetical protein
MSNKIDQSHSSKKSIDQLRRKEGKQQRSGALENSLKQKRSSYCYSLLFFNDIVLQVNAVGQTFVFSSLAITLHRGTGRKHSRHKGNKTDKYEQFFHNRVLIPAKNVVPALLLFQHA